MSQSWSTLMNLVRQEPFHVERVRMERSGIALEGDFTLPPLARLSTEDQAFAAAFLASHGSIKKMETLFDISYPTVKNRLNRIADLLDVPQVEIGPDPRTDRRREVLAQLDRGEISFDEAMEALG